MKTESVGFEQFSIRIVPFTLISALFSVIIINLVRSIDNAMVVAVSLRSLPKRLRLRTLAFGACSTIFLSVFLTLFAAKLPEHSFVRIVGGLIVLYQAVSLLVSRSGATSLDERTSKPVRLSRFSQLPI